MVGEARQQEGDGRRAGVAAWRERVREEEQGCKFPFPLCCPLPLAAPRPLLN